MFEDEEAVYGAEQIPVPGRTFDGLVDSGASFCALETALGQYMTKVERGWTAVKDYKGESTKMAHRRGQVCVCVCVCMMRISMDFSPLMAKRLRV